MSSIICMAVHDSDENGRSEYTSQTLRALMDTVDFSKHRLVVIDNASCERTREIIDDFMTPINGYHVSREEDPPVIYIRNDENIGTARAVNKGIALRKPGEFVIKMDNDCVVNDIGWVEEMELAFKVAPEIGILGLKRKDLNDRPDAPELHYQTQLQMLPHAPGEKWQIVELVREVMGTCTMYNPLLLDKVGYLWQPGLYGFDDVMISLRSKMAGFANAFLPHIDIDHIDAAETPYSGWKIQQTGERWEAFKEAYNSYKEGRRPIYEPFY